MVSSSLRQRLEDLPRTIFESVVRIEGNTSSFIDFSVLSVAVTTLAMILFVQFIRQQLDSKAIGRPFLKTVLKGVYAELAILGIVELVTFFLDKYHSGLNVAQEKTFADVHFTLFFTALFNAVQSCILAFFITRRSYGLWVTPEFQDAYHYVEIREEFDRIDKELFSLKNRTASVVDGSNQGRFATPRFLRRRQTADMDSVPTEFNYLFNNIKTIWCSIIQFAWYPHLSYRYHQLLVQAKFHELKFHFIHTNKLPITLQVSHYLKRCELHILKRMVHIDTLTWLILTAFMNFLYFILGVVVFATNGDLVTTGHALSALYFAAMIFVVILSLVLWNKVNWIFHTIMHEKFDIVESTIRSNDVIPRFDQKSLFWGHDPNYITLLIQFIQFGFALALSILLVFWDDITPKEGEVGIPGTYYVLCALIFDACFVFIIAHVMPRFTLCSSIGQMVNHKELHETFAQHRLEEAQRQLQRDMAERSQEASFMEKGTESVIHMMGQVAGSAPRQGPTESIVNPELMKELINIDTSLLRDNLPANEIEALEAKESQMLERSSHRRTLYDGVAAMRELVGLGSDQTESIPSRETCKRTHSTRKKSLSASASIQMMRDVSDRDESCNVSFGSKDDSKVAVRRSKYRRKAASSSSDINFMRNASSSGDDISILHPPMSSMPLVEGEEVSFKPLLYSDQTTRTCKQRTKSMPNFASIDNVCNENEEGKTHLPQSNVVHENVEDFTDSAESDEGYGSDEDDIPEVKELNKHKSSFPIPRKRSYMEKGHDYFRSTTYVMVSFIFGTMLCLLCVGMRLEGVMIETGVLPNPENTWHLGPKVAFWLEAALLICFIIGGAIIVLSFPHQTRFDRCIFVAAVIDILISVACFIFLIVSQVQRCCGTYFFNGKVIYGDTTYVECCPSFGERLYGGFGIVELFTSLIVLRVMRFWVAEMIVKRIISHQGDDAEVLDSMLISPQHNSGSMSARKSHHYQSMSKEIGTVVDLWKSALETHPEIVRQYGEFSSQLLQAMLGIPVIDASVNTSIVSTPKEGTLPEKKEPISNASSLMPLPSGKSFQHGGINIKSVASAKVYSALPASTQAVILAGKLGVAIRTLPMPQINPPLTGQHGEDTVKSLEQTDQIGSVTTNRIRSILKNVLPNEFWSRFDVSAEADEDEVVLQFISPNATLIRNMQRCDRKVLPMLDRWLAVDVVITNYEIVYFDASDLHDLAHASREHVMTRMENVHQAIVATKGGKGLRLRDVAIGRKIIGTQPLTKIESIHVDRIILPESMKEKAGERILDEFWKEKPKKIQGEGISENKTTNLSRDKLRKDIYEDRLKIKTLYNTLYLRFYQDLKYSELNHVNVKNGMSELNRVRLNHDSQRNDTTFKTTALQWCQTIGRLVGAGNLKQNLPNFGSNNDNSELRDYLVLHDQDNENHTRPIVGRIMNAMGGHQRTSSGSIPKDTLLGRKPSSPNEIRG